MTRRRRETRSLRKVPSLVVGGLDTRHDLDDGPWWARPMTGPACRKTYRCPGCDHAIHVGTAHTVAWPDNPGPAARRHWHTGCWDIRTGHRKPPPQTRRSPR
jgi:hypothetical protein